MTKANQDKVFWELMRKRNGAKAEAVRVNFGRGVRGASIDGSVSVLGRDEGATPVADFRNPSGEIVR